MPDRPTPDTILQDALELTDSHERAAYLDEACGSDAALRHEIESLLAAYLQADAFMDTLADPVWQEAASEKEGDRIGRYKLLQQIGEGGFGTVYLAEQTEPVKRRVALKVIKAGMDSKEVIARFEAERQALALMDHPNIAKVHDAGTTEGGRPYFVMELVKGVPLTKYCTDNDLDTKARLELFMDICAAVQHAHQKGVIHRDLKPSNILISPHDGKPVVKVIDFGIAKAISMELTEKTVFTQLGRMIGTPQYMSPEQAELNALDVDTRSDIYSLGVVLYELLTGGTPLDGEKIRSAAYGEMQRLIREETPPKPSTRVSTAARQVSTGHIPDSRSLRGDLDWIVMKALEKERERRYETANALAQDIGRHLRNEPVAAGPPSALYRMRKFARRNRRGLLSGAAAGIALLAGLTVAGGVWLNATLKESQRMAQVEGHATTMIEQVERLMEQNAAADYEDDSHFRQARNLAEQLENLVGIEEAGEELRKRRDRIMAILHSEERDRTLILGIEESRIMWLGSGSFGLPAKVEKGIAEAFGKHGSDPINQPQAETVGWLEPRRDAVRGRILAGMREWAGWLRDKTPDEAGKLTSIVLSIDKDPWRKKLYGAIEGADRVELEQLASSEEVSQQEVMTILGLAQALLAADAPAKAEQLFRRAQREHPQSFWTNFTLGGTLGELLEPTAASSGSASRGDGMSVQFGALNRRIKHRFEFDERIGFLRAAVAIRPEAAGAWKSLGNSLQNGGRLEEAVVCIQRAIELKPDMAMAHSDLGVALVDQGEFKKAIASYRKAIELDPDFALAHGNLGLALVVGKQGKHDEAIASYRRAIELDPQLAAVHGNLANVLYGQGHSEEAVASYRKAIELAPENAITYYNLGNALHGQGDLKEAVDSYRKAIKLDPDFMGSHFNLGNVLYGQGKLDEAIASFREAIKLDPNYALVHNNLGNTLRDQGEFGEAIASFRKSIELDPGSKLAYYNLGLALGNQGKLDEAITSFRKAIELDPNFAQAHKHLGSTLNMQGNSDEAVVSYRRAIELNPNVALMHRSLGEILQKQGKFEKSIDSFNRAIELDPNDAKAHWNLGNSLEDSGELEDAIVCYKRAISLDPDFSLAHSNLGMALMKQGKLTEGITCIRESIRLLPASQPPPKDLDQKMEGLEKMDRHILGIAREKGPGDPSVAVQVSELWIALGYSFVKAGEVQRFWIDHREQVLRDLEKKREVTIITLKKGLGALEAAEKIRHNLLKGLPAEKAAEQSPLEATVGARSWVARDDLNEELQDPVFATPVGGVSKIIDGSGFWAVAVVHGPKVGADHDMDEPVVKETAEALFKEHRRKNWEKNYLENLNGRVGTDTP